DHHAEVFSDAGVTTYYFWATDDGKSQQSLSIRGILWSTKQNHAIYVDNSDGGGALKLINLKSGSYKTLLIDNVSNTLESVLWSPDGDKIAVVNGTDLDLFDVEGDLLWQIPKVGGDYDAPAWTPCY